MLLLIAFLTIPHCTTSSAPPAKPRVARVWHGQVLASRADEYEKYLYTDGVQKLRAIPGNLGVDLLRRNIGEREEFIVISYWPSEEAIKGWAGEDVTKTRLMPKDLEFLIEPELTVKHFTIAVREP